MAVEMAEQVAGAMGLKHMISVTYHATAVWLSSLLAVSVLSAIPRQADVGWRISHRLPARHANPADRTAAKLVDQMGLPTSENV